MKKREGMTLIEVVVSLAIIGLIATTMLSIFNTGLINITRSGVRTTANAESEAVINSSSYTDVANVDIEVTILEDLDTDLVISIPATEYKGSVVVESGLVGDMSVEIKAYRHNPTN